MTLSTALKKIINKHGRNTLALVLNQKQKLISKNDFRCRLDQEYEYAMRTEYERRNNGRSNGKLDKDQLRYTSSLHHVYDAGKDGTVYVYWIFKGAEMQCAVYVYNDMLYSDLRWDDCNRETKESYFTRVPWWKWKILE